MAVPWIIDYYLTGNITPSVFLYIIGIAKYTDEWTALLNIYNYTMLFIGTFINTATDTVIFLSIAVFPLMSTIIKGQIEELTNELEFGEMTRMEVKIRLVQIDSMNKEYIR